MRGTLIAVADKPMGPFVPLKQDGPVPPADFMILQEAGDHLEVVRERTDLDGDVK